MVTVDHARSAASAIVLFAVLLITGCASAPPAPADDYPAITLAESKSTVQLLRNSAETRIDAEVVESRTETDESVACLDPADDPEGEIRRWLSSTEVQLVRWHAWRVADVADILIATFVNQSWFTIEGNAQFGGEATLLTSGKGATTIQVESVGDDESATLHITVNGPCVRTAGAESDEVTGLQ